MKLTGEQIGGNKPWVARITGLDPKYGLKREFVQGLRDYSGSNSMGSRGIETTWLITEPGIYEYNLPRSWKSTDRDFCEVVEGGTDIPISKIEILQKLQEVTK